MNSMRLAKNRWDKELEIKVLNREFQTFVIAEKVREYPCFVNVLEELVVQNMYWRRRVRQLLRRS